MGPEDLEKLGAAIGDVVEVTGKRTTVCRAMPAYKEIRGQSRIQLDGLPGKMQKQAWTTCNGAKDLESSREAAVLIPTNVTPTERDLKYIGSLLDGLPVMKEDHVRATLFGSRFEDFKVESTVPKIR